jgi:hypothetical protein
VPGSVVVRRFATEEQARLAQSLLEGSGVRSQIVPDPPASQFRLEVSAADAEDAIDILGAGDG